MAKPKKRSKGYRKKHCTGMLHCIEEHSPEIDVKHFVDSNLHHMLKFLHGKSVYSFAVSSASRN